MSRNLFFATMLLLGACAERLEPEGVAESERLPGQPDRSVHRGSGGAEAVPDHQQGAEGGLQAARQAPEQAPPGGWDLGFHDSGSRRTEAFLVAEVS